MFHDNKDVFIDLDVRREHFNISKIHNVKHYVESIRLLGTADGYNTESSERLHIDLAKCGYSAGNKKNYIPQMTKWLQRQEAIHHFGTYLQWAIPGYRADGEAETAEVGAEDAEAEEDDIDEEAEEVPTSSSQNDVVHSVARRPAYKGVPLESVVEDYGTLDLVKHLNTFTRESGGVVEATEATRYSIYKRAVLQLPPIREVSGSPVQDRIYAVKASEARISTKTGIRAATPTRFSTALIRTAPKDDSRGPMHGISIGEIRLIFELPPELGQHPGPLIYVHWLTPLREPLEDLGMYKIAFSSQNR